MAAPSGLDTLLQSALSAALEAGRTEIVSMLEGALSDARGSRKRYALDILAAQVRREGTLVKLSRGERALLIALALQRRPLTRAELIELLYPHLAESTAAIQLKVYVHRVRRRLGDPQTIVFQNDGYRLGSNVDVDLWQIEAEVAKAMRSKGGLPAETRSLLNQVRLRLVRRDMSWIGEIEWSITLERRLETLLYDVTTRLGEAALAEHDLSAASRLAAEVFSLDPCDERGAQLAIRAHLAAGDRSAAVREFRRYERVLKDEFGAQPSADLTGLLAS